MKNRKSLLALLFALLCVGGSVASAEDHGDLPPKITGG